MKLTFLVGLFLLAGNCESKKNAKATATNQKENSIENIMKNEIITLLVSAEQADCVGAHGKQKCLQVKEKGTLGWKLVYDGIQGFEYVPGYEYTLKVKKEKLKNPPADASAVRYTFVEIIDKMNINAEKTIDDFPGLTVTKIEPGKDGYTATLKNVRGRVHIMVVSISNLKNNYVDLKVGDKVKVDGMFSKSIPVKIFPKKIHLVKQ